MFVAFNYMVEVYEGFHYSVDMWMGAFMVNFICRTLGPSEQTDNSEVVVARNIDMASDTLRCDKILHSSLGGLHSSGRDHSTGHG
jgi:hypothetical protein